jgi:methionyl-tRNA formyltransferase
MRILFMGNNWVGWQVIRYLMKLNESVVGLVIHSKDKQRYAKEIVETANVDPSRIFEGIQLRAKETIQKIKALKPDIGLYIFFGYIFLQDFIDLFRAGILNLHPSYLPYNRGQYPNVWSIVEETPAGVTLHKIDEGIDTGNIIAQHDVPVTWTDTGESLYKKCEQSSLKLFTEFWPRIREGKAQGISQSTVAGTYHSTKDVQKIDEIDLDRKYVARDLINIIRARTFHPYKGSYFWDGDKKIYMRMQLLKENDIGG